MSNKATGSRCINKNNPLTRRVLCTAAVIAPDGSVVQTQTQTQSKDCLHCLSQSGMDDRAKEDTRIYLVLQVITP